MNNETIGISAEVAVANTFNVPINSEYEARADSAVVALLKKDVYEIFERECLPYPIEHVAEKQNPIDLILEDGTTLSIKTNQRALGKVAPQIIGQPTSKTYFEYFDDYLDIEVPVSNEEKIKLFKEISINEIETVMQHYLDKLFECDHLLYFYDVLDRNNRLKNSYQYLYIKKGNIKLDLNKRHFKFTQTIDSWVEGCTVKYITDEGKNLTIGEFQAHRNRDCLKFRFNMKNLLKLIDSI